MDQRAISALNQYPLLFDAEYYRDKNALDLLSVDACQKHFLEVGLAQNLSPHPLFDPDYYLRANPDIASLGIPAFEHFLVDGMREGRDPHPLFDTGFYSRGSSRGGVPPFYDYLSRSGQDTPNPHLLFDTSFYLTRNGAAITGTALAHYVSGAWKSSAAPHPLFDTAYYLRKYPDVASAGACPLSHFAEYGGVEGRSPCEWFDGAFYLLAYPDIAHARVNPLVHYLAEGYKELRNPHPLFNAAFYSAQYLDGSGKIDPLRHYLEIGQREGLLTNPLQRIVDFLPVTSTPQYSPLSRPVNVIIPVYRGVEETRRCISSVLAAGLPDHARVTIINDASPEPEMAEYLSTLAAFDRIRVEANAQNLGFVKTVNRGMRVDDESDVILLNSDTIVANDWIARLQWHAYSTPRVASVTPLSNNATLCSFPIQYESNSLPTGYDTNRLDQLLRSINSGRHSNVPTAVGFCMYIRRDCLQQVGFFDEEAFGRGYGEENDFCLRATQEGFTHLVAADTFVYHEGSVSFKTESLERQRIGMGVLRARYPTYEASLHRHSLGSGDLPFRFAAAAALLRRSKLPVILVVTHNLGGGIAQHLEELAAAIGDQCHLLTIEPGMHTVRLHSLATPAPIDVLIDAEHQYSQLLALLRSCGVSRVHVHHIMGFTIELERLIADLRVPFDFTVHDYYSICPQITLTDRHGRYCGEPDEAGCDDCISRRPPNPYVDIASWRGKNAWLISAADRVIAPSIDVARRMQRYFPDLHLTVAPHL